MLFIKEKTFRVFSWLPKIISVPYKQLGDLSPFGLIENAII
jgi:hypothetical protein